MQSIWERLSRDERIAYIKSAKLEEKSCTVIAHELGCTRNMVIGLAHRANINISNTPNERAGRDPSAKRGPYALRSGHRPTGKESKKVSANARKATQIGAQETPKPLPLPSPPLPPADTAVPVANLDVSDAVGFEPISFLEARDTLCRWPLWGLDDRDVQNHKYCGAPVLAGRPYCEGHARRSSSPRVADLDLKEAAGGRR